MNFNSTTVYEKDNRPLPALIEYNGMRFLITEKPNDLNMSDYLLELKKNQVDTIVRVCEASYKIDELKNRGIEIYDLIFEDGSVPPSDVIEEWFKLLKIHLIDKPECCIALHCASGLGRSPVLVALALIELGLGNEEAVDLIRERRRGCFNAKQLSYLQTYNPNSRLKMKSDQKICCCVQ